MVKLILGLKGSGKTKELVRDINETVQREAGSVVCIEVGKSLMYDVDYRVRLINAQEYGINNFSLLKGFVSGLHAGNFDITHVFIEGLYKFLGENRDSADEFLAWCESFGAANQMHFTITISEAVETASEYMQKFL